MKIKNQRENVIMVRKQYEKPSLQCTSIATDVVTTSGETMIGFNTEWLDDPSKTVGNQS